MGKKYTTEKPKTEYYGTGSSGRLTEASELRVLVEDLLSSGEYEKAIPKAKKAVQLDPGDPSGHLFLARALTNKLYQSKEEIDEKLLAECIREWQMIRYHDADPTEQWEAGNQVKALNKIAKALEKEKLIKEKEKMMELAAKKEEASKLAAKDSAVQTEIKKDIATDKRQLAEEEKGKKRFRFF
jgi:tetratricopeptide (TPR) repeat protein